jgi:hypothetical protein
MALPMAATNVAPQTPVFVNMISLLLSSPSRATSQLANAAKAPATIASPAQVADSMIRSMLGNPSSGSTVPTLSSAPTVGLPVAADARSQRTMASPAQVADSMIQSILSGSSSGSINPSYSAAAPPVAVDARTQLATTSSEQIADSTIQSILSGLSSGPIVPSLSFALAVGLPIAADERKELRGVADLPTPTAIVEPMTTSAVPASPPVARSSSAGCGPTAAVMFEPQLPAPVAVLLAKSEIAFTAILIPKKDTNTSAGTTGSSRQTVASPGITTGPSDVLSSAAIAPVAASSNPSQPLAAQASQPQAAVQGTGKDLNGPQLHGDLQQGDDTPFQQQNDSTGIPAQVIASAEPKVKPVGAKQDDNELAGTAQDRTPAADTTLTSFPDQVRAPLATQSDTPATTPTSFHSMAEILRASEPELPPAPQLRAGQAQEISIRIAQPDASTIDLRVAERSGQLHVDVRTSDAGMQSSLRQDLGTLTNSLERAGYHSETFTPSSTLGRTASGAQMNNQDEHQDQSQNRGSTGDFSGGRRQQQQQRRPSTWLEEMEDQQ